MNDEKEFIKARDYAYRLLSYQPRSTHEIDQRLNKKGFQARLIRKVIAYLKELNYLNDEDFSQLWIRTKINTHPAGRRLLEYQLRQKGINNQVINKALKDIAGQFDEYALAQQLVAARRRRYTALPPMKLKKRLYDYLYRRGFSQEAILEAIDQEVP